MKNSLNTFKLKEFSKFSHNLKNSLTVLKINLDILKNNANVHDLRSETKRFAVLANKEIKRMSKILDKYKDAGK